MGSLFSHICRFHTDVISMFKLKTKIDSSENKNCLDMLDSLEQFIDQIVVVPNAMFVYMRSESIRQYSCPRNWKAICRNTKFAYHFHISAPL